jgi:hypothetical protein
VAGTFEIIACQEHSKDAKAVLPKNFLTYLLAKKTFLAHAWSTSILVCPQQLETQARARKPVICGGNI